MLNAFISTTVMNLVLNVVKIWVVKKYDSSQIEEQLCATLAILLMMLMAWLTTRVGTLFNEDSTNSVEDEQEKQAEIMESVSTEPGECRKFQRTP